MVSKMNTVGLYARSYVDALRVAMGAFGAETSPRRMPRRHNAEKLSAAVATKKLTPSNKAADTRI